MKIAIVGATGNVGASVTAEAVRRGHTVTGHRAQRGVRCAT
jgi:putative NADH-flavin reductase